MMEGDPKPFEVTDTLLADEILPRLLTCSTSLFAAKTRTETNPTYCGSGTFVATGGRRCLLTAEHVWRLVERDGPCLLLGVDHSASPSRDHPLAIENLQFMGPPRYITKRLSEEWGPDLALLHLPDLHAELALLTKAFYDLDKRRERALSSRVSHTTGLWAMLAAPAEHSSVGPDGLIMQSYAFGSTIERATARGDFDYLDFRIKNTGATPLLRSFGGVSGAGLWRCTLRRTPAGKVECDQCSLEGVAFYQQLDREGNGFIRCHGRASIFRGAREAKR